MDMFYLFGGKVKAIIPINDLAGAQVFLTLEIRFFLFVSDKID